MSSRPNSRRHERLKVFIPVSIDAGERTGRVGVSRDASPGGVCLCAASKFKIGETLRVTFAIGTDDVTTGVTVTGKVVRIDSPRALANTPWLQLLGVQFDAEQWDLASSLKGDAVASW